MAHMWKRSKNLFMLWKKNEIVQFHVEFCDVQVTKNIDISQEK